MNFQDGGPASLRFDWVFFSLEQVTWRAVTFLILPTLSLLSDWFSSIWSNTLAVWLGWEIKRWQLRLNQSLKSESVGKMRKVKDWWLRQGPIVSLLRRWWKHVSHWNHSKSSQCPAAFWKLPPITLPRENTHVACILINWLLEKHNIRDIWWHFSYLKWHGHMASQGVGGLLQWWFQNSRHPLQIL